MNVCSYLKLLILQQFYYERPHIIHCFLVAHECKQVVKNHDLQVCEHRVAGMPRAAASNLKPTETNPSVESSKLLFHKKNECPGLRQMNIYC